MKKISLILSILFISACNQFEQSAQEEVVTPVETTLLVSDNRIRHHSVPAILIAVNRVQLAFQLSGTVNQVLVKVGETVEKDQALMQLYNPNIDPALEGNLAQLESIKAQIGQARRDVANLKELRKNNSASKNAFEQKETQLKELLAKKKGMQAQIDLALANQSESIVKAPYDGTVVRVNKQVGEFIQAGVPVISLVQNDKLEVEVNITHELWKNLSLGMLIKAHYQQQELEFSVTEMAQAADASSHLMKVILQLQSPLENGIGQQVNVMFPEFFNDVYHLPLEVIVDDGINQPYIFNVQDQKAQKLAIKPLYIEKGQIIFTTQEKITGAVVIKGQAKISQGMLLQELK